MLPLLITRACGLERLAGWLVGRSLCRRRFRTSVFQMGNDSSSAFVMPFHFNFLHAMG